MTPAETSRKGSAGSVRLVAAASLLLAISPVMCVAAVKGSLAPVIRSYGPPKEFENVGHTTQPVRPSYTPLHAAPVKVRATPEISG